MTSEVLEQGIFMLAKEPVLVSLLVADRPEIEFGYELNDIKKALQLLPTSQPVSRREGRLRL